MAGKFIVFEGIDGSGKETQISMLAKRLAEDGIRFSLFKYPTADAVKIHDYLSGRLKPEKADDVFSWYADDLKGGQGEVKKCLENGWAISDRYVVSTAAYQGVDGKLSERMARLEKMKFIAPDAIIWLDIEVDEAMRRKGAQKTPDVHEKNRKFLGQVAENYAALHGMKWLAPNWKKIDANGEKEAVFAQVRRALGL